MLKFGILCDQLELKEWQKQTIDYLTSLEQVECSLLMQVTTEEHLRRNKRRASIPSLSLQVPVLELKENEHKRVQLSKMDVEEIKSYQLDFILSISSKNIPDEMIVLPTHDVWTFDHCLKKKPYWREIYDGNAVTEAALLKLERGGKCTALKTGYFATHFPSYRTQKCKIKRAISRWPAYVCKEMLSENDTSDPPAVPKVNKALDPERHPTYREALIFSGKLFLNQCQSLYSKLFCYEYWNIGTVDVPIDELLTSTEPEIQWIIPKKNLYFADPFAYKTDQGIKIIMEELDYRKVKGFISEAELGNAVDSAGVRETIKLPTHMSYPFIIEEGEHTYCVPETSEANEVSLYQLNQVNRQWEKITSLISNFPGVDSTLFKWRGCWWLFCTKGSSDSDSHNNELHIYYAEDLLGEWTPHSLNPVKIDVRSSRPAGTPFFHDNELYRPAQDCSETYGGRIVMNKIETLSLTEFKETPVSCLEPKPDSLYPDGLHTVSMAYGKTILDGKRLDYHFTNLFKKIYKYKPLMNKKKVPAHSKEVKGI
ncbi:hypothetical protein MUN89_05585 [Halobacillus salinarum]|uniref:Glucosamine inositolphosphorylceramide transferase 1 N-terminal domain-containing protein n=1 Tax=Halobacillus salinarum TaxID=2932257 RepID=A0ABY4EMR0_9BACI|nr:hypothetical protein [Halobacillus salinarum]UOQ45418.1 hypothetical protein MUN89_05585 [Halobacillus salinarum]